MRCLLLAALLALGLGVNPASALEIKNIRNCYAPPFAGATRPNLKIQGGDLIFITYDIEGLHAAEKSGKVSYTSTLELVDSAGKQLFRKDTPGEVLPQLGGTSVPGEINVEIPSSQKVGKYKIRMTITDKAGKDTKSFEYLFEVMAPAFGVVGVTAPAIGLIGTYHTTQFAMVHMKLDDKKQPKLELLMRVLDAAGKELSKLESSFPKDLPADVDLGKANFLPWHYPIYLNRTGRFTIEITARDSSGVVTITYPFTVLDATTLSPK